MKCKHLFFLSALLWTLASPTAHAQMSRTIYQTFELDSAQTVVLDLVGFTEVQIEAWAGNTVLTEVNVQLWQASPEILNYFVEQGRYKFGFEKPDTNHVNITTQVRERKVIRTKLSGPTGCPEITTVKIFVPDNYAWTPVPEGDSDGTVTLNEPGRLQWRSGNSGNSTDESFDDRNKHKLVKTLSKKPSE